MIHLTKAELAALRQILDIEAASQVTDLLKSHQGNVAAVALYIVDTTKWWGHIDHIIFNALNVEGVENVRLDFDKDALDYIHKTVLTGSYTRVKPAPGSEAGTLAAVLWDARGTLLAKISAAIQRNDLGLFNMTQPRAVQ